MYKPRLETRKVGEFVAADSEGRQYVVSEFQDFFEHHLLVGRAWVAGLKDFRLADGTLLHQTSKDTFELSSTGATIRRL